MDSHQTEGFHSTEYENDVHAESTCTPYCHTCNRRLGKRMSCAEAVKIIKGHENANRDHAVEVIEH